jgi:hypothetical protein
MITAVDTSILLDILIPDITHLNRSKALLDDYVVKGRLIICEIVYAELASQFDTESGLNEFLADTGIKLVRSAETTLYRAAGLWREYLKNNTDFIQCPHCHKDTTVNCQLCHQQIKPRQRILSDFIVGAHALMHAELLLSRDSGFYRAYFKDLKVEG